MRLRIDFLNICIGKALFSLMLLLFANDAFSSTINYEYDLSGQLVIATDGGAGRTVFTYDDAGNMTLHTVTGYTNTPSSAMLLLVSPSEPNEIGSILAK